MLKLISNRSLFQLFRQIHLSSAHKIKEIVVNEDKSNKLTSFIIYKELVRLNLDRKPFIQIIKISNIFLMVLQAFLGLCLNIHMNVNQIKDIFDRIGNLSDE